MLSNKLKSAPDFFGARDDVGGGWKRRKASPFFAMGVRVTIRGFNHSGIFRDACYGLRFSTERRFSQDVSDSFDPLESQMGASERGSHFSHLN